jgi:hypothetical protein
LSAILLASAKALNDIKMLIQNKSAVIVPGICGDVEIQLSSVSEVTING